MVLPSRQERNWSAPNQGILRLLFRRIRRVSFTKRCGQILICAALLFALVLQISQDLPVNDLMEDGTANSCQTIVLKDAKGSVVSRKKEFYGLSDFLPALKDNTTPIYIDKTLAETMKVREPIVSILRDAGICIDKEDVDNILQLPTWQQITDLYGHKPIITGLERCENFRRQVPLQHRFMAIAGNFNSGTTAFGLSLQANCRFSNHQKTNENDPYSNDVVSHVNGMLSQVPWAKHKMAFYRDNHTILASIPKQNVLPIVLIRDPYFWMQSMCKQGYGVRWDHQEQHCPNLIPNEYDWKRFGKKWTRQNINMTSIKVWMGANPQTGPCWDSLVHYWNAWYESYINVDWPRLIIRFEDTLFHPKQVMQVVCQCGGGELVEPFQYLIDKAKWNHKHAQNNMITAMIKYGSGHGRFHNMTTEDMTFAQKKLNPRLIKTFQYHQD